MTTHLYQDAVFAPLDPDHALVRIAGGSETDVYRTDDWRWVAKLKPPGSRGVGHALALARQRRDIAQEFATWLGPEHTVPSHFFLARDSAGLVQVVVVQPCVTPARPLAQVNWSAQPPDHWAGVVAQLRTLARRARRCFRATGHMPDLYGSFSGTTTERLRLNAPRQWPGRVWDFWTRQTLLRAHNLLLTAESPPRVVLVDFDAARWGGLAGRLYYTVCRLLLWRDLRRLRRAATSPQPHATL